MHGHPCIRLGAQTEDLPLELGVVPPACLLLGFIHGGHLFIWWTPSLPLRPIPSRVGWPDAYGNSTKTAFIWMIVRKLRIFSRGNDTQPLSGVAKSALKEAFLSGVVSEFGK